MTKEQRWILKSFSKLIKKYAGQYVAVVNNKVVASGRSAKKLEDYIKSKFKVDIPSIVLVPHKEDLIHVLLHRI